ncbi:MAG TPA: hypothetical protein VMF08_15875 [Candidatus Sulfotelmatobacter sp.]|nr:hypothetical protein [Candidatus Sulfotelmatobacter sp.]
MSNNMSEHHDHTEFLKHCLRYDDSPERHAMTEKLTRLQCELRAVQRASVLMGALILPAAAGLAWPWNLVPSFSYEAQRFIMNIVLGLFAGSSVCLLTFIILAVFIYKKMHRQREACRQLLMRLFAARLGSEQS